MDGSQKLLAPLAGESLVTHAARAAVEAALGPVLVVTGDRADEVAAAWRPGRIVVPTFDGRPGHPVALAAEFLPELARLSGDRGARPVVLAHPEAVIELEIEDPAVVTDVDDAAALDRVRGMCAPPPDSTPPSAGTRAR